MATPVRPFVGDIGTEIIIDLQEDITGATDKKIYYEKPSGLVGSWGTAVVTVVDNTKLKFVTTLATDLDEAGIWIFNPWVVLPGGTWTGKTVSQYIYALYEGD